MDSNPSPAAATPPATGDGCFPINKRQLNHSPAIHLVRQRYVVQSAERQRRMRDRDAAMISEAHRLHAHEPSRDAASLCSGSLNKTMCTQDVEQTVQNCDWISTMPDDILIKILSLLTVSDAAITGCLSTRWRHLWKNIDRLILDPHNLRMQESEICYYHANPCLWKAEAAEFVRKTNGLLRNHFGNKIKEFTVRFPLTPAHASKLNQWIRFATSASTEKFCLDLYGKHHQSSCCVWLRSWKFSSKRHTFLLSQISDGRGCRLNELTLSNCTVGTNPANLSGFACVRFLKLSRVSIADAALSNIISSCCALQTLILEFCHELIHLMVTHSQLLNFDLDFCNGLISVCIHADKLEAFMYKGHKVNIEYEYAPFLEILRVYFTNKNECPLDFVSALPKLPKLESLSLQCPAPVQVPRALRHTFRFANLKVIIFFLVRSWEGCICSLAYLLQTAPLLERFGLHGFSKLKEPSELNMAWPEDLTWPRLHSILIKGFSGEPELMELLYFLLTRAPALESLELKTHALEPWFVRKEKHKLQDEERRRYAMDMASTHLAPKVPSTVVFSIT